MPFLVEISVPEFDGPVATLVKWLVQPGIYIGWDKPIALIDINGASAKLICNMPVVIEAWSSKAGDRLEAGMSLASAQAEGDEIPYGKPYARFE